MPNASNWFSNTQTGSGQIWDPAPSQLYSQPIYEPLSGYAPATPPTESTFEEYVTTVATKSKNFKVNPAPSPPSSLHQALTSQLRECKESLSRELGELENAKSELARITEVVEEAGSRVLLRISTLQQVANQLETTLQTVRLQDSATLVPAKSAASSLPPGADPSVAFVAPQFGLGLSQQDQG